MHESAPRATSAASGCQVPLDAGQQPRPRRPHPWSPGAAAAPAAAPVCLPQPRFKVITAVSGSSAAMLPGHQFLATHISQVPQPRLASPLRRQQPAALMSGTYSLVAAVRAQEFVLLLASSLASGCTGYSHHRRLAGCRTYVPLVADGSGRARRVTAVFGLTAGGPPGPTRSRRPVKRGHGGLEQSSG